MTNVPTHKSLASAVQPPASSAPASPPAHALAKLTADTAELAPRQQAAILALASGEGFSKAAEVAGVSRQTIYNWRRTDPRFAALLHAWETDTKASAQHRLLSMVDNAVANVDAAVSAGDTRISLELLRRMGVLAPIALGETDPDVHEREVNNVRGRREAEQRLAKSINDAQRMLDEIPPDFVAEEISRRAAKRVNSAKLKPDIASSPRAAANAK